DPRPAPHTPAARSPRAPRTREPRLAVAQRASPLSAVDVLQNGDVQHRLGQQLLQPRVLVLQRLQPPRIRHVETAELGLPLVKRRARDPMLAANVCRRAPRLLLAQDPDDLLFAEPTALHRPSPLEATDSTQFWKRSRVSRQSQSALVRGRRRRRLSS